VARGTSPEDRALIEALMQQGWYRERELPPDLPGLGRWRFRAGHDREDPARPSVIVRAPSERLAMQTLLESLTLEDGPGEELTAFPE
jgi:hypothetical protein